MTVTRSPKRCCESVTVFEGSTDDEPGTQAYCFTKYFQNTFLLYCVLVLGHAATFLTYLYVMFSNNVFPVDDAKICVEVTGDIGLQKCSMLPVVQRGFFSC